MLTMLPIWNFVKKNWQLFLVVAIMIGAYSWVQRQQNMTANMLQELNNAHVVEIEKIEKAKQLEAEQHAKQLQELRESITKIELNYTLALEQIQREKNQNRIEIVKKYSHDIDGLAELTAEKLDLHLVPSDTK